MILKGGVESGPKKANPPAGGGHKKLNKDLKRGKRDTKIGSWFFVVRFYFN